MSTTKTIEQYPCVGQIAPLMRKFIELKVSAGYKYIRQAYVLDRFSRFCYERFGESFTISECVIRAWRQKNHDLAMSTQNQLLHPIRDFSLYLTEVGCEAFVPQISSTSTPGYVPHIYSEDELRRFFDACDNIELKNRFTSNIPMAFPVIFRMLFGCGLRITEALHLHTRDVDTLTGVLRIIHAKDDKERLVPMSSSLTKICRAYLEYKSVGIDSPYFFHTEYGMPFNHSTIHERFKQVLKCCGIEHLGRGWGPRIHDFRHTHAVYAMRHAQCEMLKPGYFLPLLSTYLGHENIFGTEKYLHLPQEFHGELRDMLCQHTENTIPEVDDEK